MKFEQFEQIRDSFQLSTYLVAKYSGISESTFTNTRKRGKKLSAELEGRILSFFETHAVLLEKTDYFDSAWWTGDIAITVKGSETKIWDKTSEAFKNRLPSVLIRFETPPQYQDVLKFVLVFKGML